MKERPILFSTEMVNAILAGRKTQTRRAANNLAEAGNKRPYNPGDQLWVRESHFVTWDKNNNITVLFRDGVSIRFYYKHLPLNTLKKLKKRKSLNKSWVPGRFMPKAFARIWLQNENVKVERLQEISEADAIAEGIEPTLVDDEHYPNTGKIVYKNYDGPDWGLTAKESYQTLWDSINNPASSIEHPASWQGNPWVWAITFKVLSTTGNPAVQEIDSINKQTQPA